MLGTGQKKKQVKKRLYMNVIHKRTVGGKRCMRFSYRFISGLLLLTAFCFLLQTPTSVIGAEDTNTITLNAFEYYSVNVTAHKGQVLSGDWDVSPADVITPPFLVFIVSTEHFVLWSATNNLTQAISRIPSKELLYLYDPFFRTDDIPFDNYRSDIIQVKVPADNTWHLVFYAGATAFPLRFHWHLDVFEGAVVNAVIWGLGAIILVAIVATFVIYQRKEQKKSFEEEFERIKQEENNKSISLLELTEDEDYQEP